MVRLHQNDSSVAIIKRNDSHSNKFSVHLHSRCSLIRMRLDLNSTPHPRLSLLGIPAEIRLNLYPYIFRGSTIRFSSISKKWWPSNDGASLVLVCRTIHTEAISLLSPEVMLDLPSCQILWYDDLYEPYRCVTSRLPAATRSSVRHLRFKSLPQPDYSSSYYLVSHYSSKHLREEAALFSEVKTMTARSTCEEPYVYLLPQTYTEILKYVKKQAREVKQHRYQLPMSVTLRLECFIYAKDGSGSLEVTTDEKCETVLALTTQWKDPETGEVIGTKWTDYNIRQMPSVELARIVALTIRERSLKEVGLDKWHGMTEPKDMLKEALQLQKVLLASARTAVLESRNHGSAPWR